MKMHLILIILIVACIPSLVFAQDTKEDVIYLKNGSIYKGSIIEQVPNLSYKIEIAGGSVIVVYAADVQRVTREERMPLATGQSGAALHTQDEYMDTRHRYRRDSNSGLRGYKDNGGFLQVQLDVQWAGGSARLIGGYKINQFAMVGVGVGFGGVTFGANNASIDNPNEPYSGFYFPFFVYYSGDILQKNITPFYAVELGYAMANNFDGGDGGRYSYYSAQNNYQLRGGVMGSAGFGVRFYKGRRFVCTLSANLDVQDSHATTYYYQGNNLISSDYRSVYLLIPSFKIGLGFVK